MSDPKENVTLSFDQLKELIKEIRKPADPTPDQEAALVQAKQMREDRAKLELERIEARKFNQSICAHTRPENGTTRCVHIFGTNNLNDYMICQECNAFIHAEPRPTEGPLAKELENHIFDTRLFNIHYRMSQARTTF